MFLRSQNHVPEINSAIDKIDRRIVALTAQVNPVASESDALARLELAGILCWRGRYLETRTLIEPLTVSGFSHQISFTARQLIADNHFRHDQYDLASKQYHANFEASSAAGDSYWAARAEDGIAWVLIDVGHYTTGEFETAAEIFGRMVEMHRRLGNRNAEGMGLYGLSRAYAGMGNYGKGIEFAERSIEVLKIEGEFLLQLPLLQIANIHRDRGNFELAANAYELAIDAADRSQDPYIQCLTGIERGILYQYLSQAEQAITIWRLALETIRELDFPRLGLEVCVKLAAIFADRKEFEEAYRMQAESQQFASRVGLMSSNLHNQQMLLREQMHRSAQLEKTLTFLRTGADASVDGIFVLERVDSGIDEDEFIFHYLNESAAVMLDKKVISVNHVPVRSSWKSDSAELLLHHSRAVLENGEPCTLDPVELEFKPGEVGCYSVKIAKIAGGVVWTVSDVSRREAMQREMLAQRDRLEQANGRLTAMDREKSEMLGVAAHDLRSPIGNIRALSELVETEDPDSQDLLRMIGEISDSLLKLISNLLDVEQIERGEIEMDLKPVPIVPLVSRLVDQFAPAASAKEISILLDMPQEMLSGWGDESALSRAMENLISNAIKFSPSGSCVWVRALDFESGIRVEIQDQGCGITEADRKKLFGKFARLSARPTGSESSTGLGLSIVKHLVEAMSGAVGCDSEPGNGATFWIEIPKSQSSRQAA